MKKKILSILLILVMVFGLTGCGAKTTKVSQLNKTIKVDDWEITMKKIEYSSGYCKVLNEYFLTSNETYKKNGDSNTYVCTQEYAGNDKEYLLFEINAKYIGKENTSRGFTGFKLDYNNGYIVDADTVYLSNDNERWIYIDGEAINHQEVKIDALENPNFTIRGAFKINKKIESDTNSSLLINTPFNFIYEIR